jgi:WD40 repeat protein
VLLGVDAHLSRGVQVGQANWQINVFGGGTGPAPTIVRERRRVLAIPPLLGREVPRPGLTRLLRELLLGDGPGTVGMTTGLRGAGGFGKTTLARMLVHDPAVQERFPGGIVWTTIGEETSGPDLAAKVNEVTWQLTADRPPLTDPDQAGAELGRALGEARVLLVIDDVWSSAQLEPFLHDGPATVRLITTRQRSVLPVHAHTVDVDAMERSEASATLLAGLTDVPASLLARLLSVTGSWPVLLALVNAAARADVQAGLDPVTALREIVVTLTADGPTALDVADRHRRDRAVATTVEASLERLNVEERQRYLELAIFEEDVEIPLAVLGRYWLRTGGWRAGRIQQFCRRLVDLSLVVEYCLADPPRLRLHDVIRGYLRHQMCAQMPSLHAALIDSHRHVPPSVAAGGSASGQGSARCETGVTAWWLLPSEHQYLWARLGAHLHAAGLDDELRQLLHHPEYLVGKLDADGPAGLQADLALLDDSITVSLNRVVTEKAHLLGPIDPPGSLRASLATLLGTDPTLSGLAGALDANVAPPRLRLMGRWPLAVPAQGVRREGHAGLVHDLIAAPDGSWLATGGDDATVRIWNVATGECTHLLTGHSGRVRKLVVAPDGSWLASASQEGGIHVWDPTNGRCLHRRAVHNDIVVGLATPSDGTWLVSADYGGKIVIWDPRTMLPVHTVREHPRGIEALVAAPDGSWFATGCDDHVVRIWSPHTGECLHALTGHTDAVVLLGVLAGGRALASLDGWTTRVWNPTEGSLQAVLPPTSGVEQTLLTAVDARWVATSRIGGPPRVWDLAKGTVQREFTGALGGALPLTSPPDGTWLAAGGMDGSIEVWDIDTGSVLCRLIGHTAPVAVAVVSPMGNWLASAAEDASVRIWDLRNRRCAHTLAGDAREMTEVTVARGSGLVATGTLGGDICTWAFPGGEPIAQLAGHAGPVLAMTLPKQGGWLATTGYDGAVVVWDPYTGHRFRALTGHVGWVHTLATADGSWLAGAGLSSELFVWDVESGQLMHRLQAGEDWTWQLAASPDGSWLASAGEDRRVRIWDPADGRLRHALTGHTAPIVKLATAPNGAWLASAGWDRSVRIWDPVSGEQRQVLHGHTGPVGSMVISPDGTWLATADTNATIMIWDTEDGTPRHTLTWRGWPTWAMASSADARLLATASDGVVRIWDTTTGAVMTALRLDARLTRVVWLEDQRLAVGGPRGAYLLDLLTDRHEYVHDV